MNVPCPMRRIAASVRGALHPRPLLPDERRFLRSLFGDSLALDTLRICSGGHPLGRIAWQPMAATMQFDARCFADGDEERSLHVQAYPILAHEALHVWQRVHRHCRVHVSVDGLWLGALRGAAAYHYDRSLRDPDALLREFLAGNIEQQAQIFEDWVRSCVEDEGARDPRFCEVARYVRSRAVEAAG